MKKLVAILLAVLILSLAGCGVVPQKHSLTFIEGKNVTISINGEEKVFAGIFCEYTNKSGQTCMPCDAINVKAFQNGKELSVVVFTGDRTDGFIQCDTSVQDGTTAQVVWLFEKQDESEVSVEFTDGQKFTFSLNK